MYGDDKQAASSIPSMNRDDALLVYLARHCMYLGLPETIRLGEKHPLEQVRHARQYVHILDCDQRHP